MPSMTMEEAKSKGVDPLHAIQWRDWEFLAAWPQAETKDGKEWMTAWVKVKYHGHMPVIAFLDAVARSGDIEMDQRFPNLYPNGPTTFSPGETKWMPLAGECPDVWAEVKASRSKWPPTIHPVAIKFSPLRGTPQVERSPIGFQLPLDLEPYRGE